MNKPRRCPWTGKGDQTGTPHPTSEPLQTATIHQQMLKGPHIQLDTLAHHPNCISIPMVTQHPEVTQSWSRNPGLSDSTTLGALGLGRFHMGSEGRRKTL